MTANYPGAGICGSQRRVAGGRAEDICGPRRGEKRKAEEDLEALRAAAEQAGPDAAWSAMADVSQCLQERARFEGTITCLFVFFLCVLLLQLRAPLPLYANELQLQNFSGCSLTCMA